MDVKGAPIQGVTPLACHMEHPSASLGWYSATPLGYTPWDRSRVASAFGAPEKAKSAAASGRFEPVPICQAMFDSLDNGFWEAIALSVINVPLG